MNKIKRSFLASLLVAISPVSHSNSVDQDYCESLDPGAKYWLEKLLCKAQDIKHAGVLAAERGSGLDLYRVENGQLATMNSNRLSILSGGGERSILNESSESCLYRDSKLKKSSLACDISVNYRVSVTGPGIVSGRSSVVILLEPRDQHRYLYSLQVDKMTGLLLGMKTMNFERSILENFRFATVDIEEKILGPRSIEANNTNDFEVKKPTDRFFNLELGWVPTGFESYNVRTTRTSSLNFTDGLASFTVFVERRNENFPPNDESTVVWGSTGSYVIAKKIEKDWFLITVIGDIPVGTARRIARSVRWSS